jgi:hypothetical protein
MYFVHYGIPENWNTFLRVDRSKVAYDDVYIRASAGSNSLVAPPLRNENPPNIFLGHWPSTNPLYLYLCRWILHTSYCSQMQLCYFMLWTTNSEKFETRFFIFMSRFFVLLLFFSFRSFSLNKSKFLCTQSCAGSHPMHLYSHTLLKKQNLKIPWKIMDV